jgi:hypothetical protein
MPAPGKSGSTSAKWPVSAALVANLLIVAVLAIAAALNANDADLYYRSAQEDGLLEWATFWSFALAAVALVAAGINRRKTAGRFPWFFWGVAAFCLFVAMEEISWGQRLFGYRPPEYFLRENFQQELNVHNIFGTSLRKFLLKAVILGYGVILPLLAAPKPARRLLEQLDITAPPLSLAPAFLVTFITYANYPWSFTGEWVELMLGLGFLFAALFHFDSMRADRALPTGHLRIVAAGMSATVILGIASAGLSLLRPGNTHQMITATRTEMETLARDFTVNGRMASRCGIHKRVYSFVEKYQRDQLYEGEYAALTEQGLPEERAQYFLDPWNSPVWIRHKCNDRTTRQRAFVYSFGPDRRRDSSSWEIRGDDIGVMILVRDN